MCNMSLCSSAVFKIHSLVFGVQGHLGNVSCPFPSCFSCLWPAEHHQSVYQDGSLILERSWLLYLWIFHLETLLEVQRLRLHAPHARGPGFMPGQGTKIPHTARSTDWKEKEHQRGNKNGEPTYCIYYSLAPPNPLSAPTFLFLLSWLQ